MEMSWLGKRIFAYRVKHNISQREMADRLGTYLNQIWRLEQGRGVHSRNEKRLSDRLDKLERSERNV